MRSSISPRLVLLARETTGREASPSAGVIDSESVKTIEAGGPRGYAAEKKVMGRKRHIITDTSGHLIGAVVHPADVQDRDGAPLVIEAIRHAFPWLRHLFADAAYADEKLEAALRKLGPWTIEIVRRVDAAKGFVLLPSAPSKQVHSRAAKNSNPPTRRVRDESLSARMP